MYGLPVAAPVPKGGTYMLPKPGGGVGGGGPGGSVGGRPGGGPTGGPDGFELSPFLVSVFWMSVLLLLSVFCCHGGGAPLPHGGVGIAPPITLDHAAAL